MHYRLPDDVRLAIAMVDGQVSHTLTWGCYTQAAYPGECRWQVTEGSDWPICADIPITVTMTRFGVEVDGIETVEAHIERTNDQLESDPANANLHNQLDTLQQVLEVLKVARSLQEPQAIAA